MPHSDPERRREYDRVRKRVAYDEMGGVEYSRLLMRLRRGKALARRKKRDQLRIEEGT